MNFTPLLQNKIVKNIETIGQKFILITSQTNNIHFQQDSSQFFSYIKQEINNFGKNNTFYLLSCKKTSAINNSLTFLSDILYRNHYNVFACNKSNQLEYFEKLQKKQIQDLAYIIECFENLFENLNKPTFSTDFIEKIITKAKMEKFRQNNFYIELVRFINSILNTDKKIRLNSTMKNLRTAYKSFIDCNIYLDVNKQTWKKLLEYLEQLFSEIQFVETLITVFYMTHLISQHSNKTFIIHGKEEVIDAMKFILNNKFCKAKERKMFRHLDI